MQEPVAAPFILDFLHHGIQLKEVARQGWILKGIRQPESVADHAFNCCILAMVYARARGLDERRMMALAITHDIGETIIGDRIWERGRIANAQKQRLKHDEERTAIRQIFSNGNLADVQALVEEFLDQKTEEARAMKEIDKLEMVMQALAYEQKVEDPSTLLEFWESAAKYLYSPFAWSIFEALKARSTITVPLPTRPAR